MRIAGQEDLTERDEVHPLGRRLLQRLDDDVGRAIGVQPTAVDVGGRDRQLRHLRSCPPGSGRG